ncbi:MAG: SulP family inorganic anion transporter [Porphyromonadaceae bacterium]|nr:SulP family inorganic anion transporter [Porphyromonadaceae bacterium]
MTSFSFRPRLLDALKGYTHKQLTTDLMAGVIVGIVALPLAIAFGVASGVSPEIGLLTAIIGGFIVSALGGSSVQIGGPTGAFIVIVYGVIQQYGISGLLISTFLAGILLVLMGALRLGSLIKFIPYPIIVGFTAGIALTIFSTQVNDLLGLGIESMPADFFGKWSALLSSLGDIHPLTALIGLGSIIVIVLTPRMTKVIPGSLVAIVLMTLLAYVLKSHLSVEGIQTIGDRFTISGEWPPIVFPELSLESIRTLAAPTFTIAMLGAIESLLSASVADGVIGERHDSNTELIAQGLANMVVPFLGGIPVTGAIARTMTNINNGGRTPISGIVHTVTLLLIFLFLMPLTAYIPMACLSGVLVVVSYNMSGWRSIKAQGKGPRGDLMVLWLTLILTVVFDLTIAIEIGLLLSMLFFMRRMVETTRIFVSRDELDLLAERDDQGNAQQTLSLPHGVEVYEIEGPFFFGIANRFEEMIASVAKPPKVRIIRMRSVPFIDSTAANNLAILCRNSEDEGVRIILSGVNDRVYRTLARVGLLSKIGAGYVCRDIHAALEVAERYLQGEQARL